MRTRAVNLAVAIWIISAGFFFFYPSPAADARENELGKICLPCAGDQCTQIFYGLVCKIGACQASDKIGTNQKSISHCSCTELDITVGDVSLTSGISENCTREYGEPEDGGVWKCISGYKNTNQLNYCVSTKGDARFIETRAGEVAKPAAVGRASAAISQAALSGQSNIVSPNIKTDINELIKIKIPDLNFSKIGTNIDAAGNLIIPWIGEYIGAIYNYAMIIASIIAVVMLIIQGILVVVSAGGELKNTAFKRIGQILIGLIILWGSYAIMYTINPNLVSFQALKIQYIRPLELPIDEDADDPLPPSGSAVCRSVNDCKRVCSEDRSRWAAEPSGIITVPIENINGIIADQSIMISSELITPLRAAGARALAEDYQLNINDGFRSEREQVDLACRRLESGREADLGRIVAWPGTSNHGKGIAVDVSLIKNKRVISRGDMNDGLIDKLENIMNSAGFVRYCGEWWHFEWGTEGKPARPSSKGSPCPRPYTGKR